MYGLSTRVGWFHEHFSCTAFCEQIQRLPYGRSRRDHDVAPSPDRCDSSEENCNAYQYADVSGKCSGAKSSSRMNLVKADSFGSCMVRGRGVAS